MYEHSVMSSPGAIPRTGGATSWISSSFGAGGWKPGMRSGPPESVQPTSATRTANEIVFMANLSGYAERARVGRYAIDSRTTVRASGERDGRASDVTSNGSQARRRGGATVVGASSEN